MQIGIRGYGSNNINSEWGGGGRRLYLSSFLFSAFAVYIIGFSSFNFVFSISCMILCVLTFFSKIVLSTSSFPFFCICCSYHLKFIISLFCSLNYSLHFLFFFINALSCIGSLFILSRSFSNAFCCILPLLFSLMLFLYPVSFSLDLSHICLCIVLLFTFLHFIFLLIFVFHSSIRSLIFLCILSVFIHYCIFFNLRFIILSFFVHLKIIFLKFSAHIYCLSWVFVFLHYISSITSLSPVLYSFSVS